MLRIFVSHTWGASKTYEDFVSLLNSILGCGGWNNLSVRQSEAIDLASNELLLKEKEIEYLNEQLVRAEARYADPSLPDVIARIVWKANGQMVEVETTGSLASQINLLRHKLANHSATSELLSIRQSTYKAIGKNGRIKTYINEYPELCYALRQRINEADIVFAILSPDVIIRRWVNYEIDLASSQGKRIIGVRTPQFERLSYYDMLCEQTIELNKTQVENAIKCVDMS